MKHGLESEKEEEEDCCHFGTALLWAQDCRESWNASPAETWDHYDEDAAQLLSSEVLENIPQEAGLPGAVAEPAD